VSGKEYGKLLIIVLQEPEYYQREEICNPRENQSSREYIKSILRYSSSVYKDQYFCVLEAGIWLIEDLIRSVGFYSAK
jgi:hypothetical protein